MSGLEILSIAPGASIQDRGRNGYLRFGVTSSGAMDDFALAEGQALLANGPDAAALEFAGAGGTFQARSQVWVALTGAEMVASLNGKPVGWRQSLKLAMGDILAIGGAVLGVYGYLHVTGGFRTETVLGARATHSRAGFGHVAKPGDILPVGDGGNSDAPDTVLPRPAYLECRRIRALWGPQSHLFDEPTRSGFAAAQFTVTPMRDRMGIRVMPSSGPVSTAGGLTIASDAVLPGDIQITGDGTPAILLADRGPSGGYPRIATVATADLATLAQMPVGAEFTLEFVDRQAAVAALLRHRADLMALPKQVRPLLRDPRDIADLLAYNLVGGMVRGDEQDAN